MIKSTVCILFGASDQQRKNYLEFAEKTSDIKYYDNYPDIKNSLEYEEGSYIITQPPKESTKTVIKKAKEFGAEIVGVFFNKQAKPICTDLFDRLILQEMVV